MTHYSRIFPIDTTVSPDKPIDRYVYSSMVHETLEKKAAAIEGVVEVLRSVRKLAAERMRKLGISDEDPSFPFRFGDSRVDLIAAVARLIANPVGRSTEVPDALAFDMLAGEIMAKLLLYFADAEVNVPRVLADYGYVRLFGARPLRGA